VTALSSTTTTITGSLSATYGNGNNNSFTASGNNLLVSARVTIMNRIGNFTGSFSAATLKVTKALGITTGSGNNTIRITPTNAANSLGRLSITANGYTDTVQVTGLTAKGNTAITTTGNGTETVGLDDATFSGKVAIATGGDNTVNIESSNSAAIMSPGPRDSTTRPGPTTTSPGTIRPNWGPSSPSASGFKTTPATRYCLIGATAILGEFNSLGIRPPPSERTIDRILESNGLTAVRKRRSALQRAYFNSNYILRGRLGVRTSVITPKRR